MGVAMAITAFPVLARILTDRGLTRTELGVVALGCAAIDDVTAWCLLAFVVGIARAQVGEGLLVTAGALGYIAGMLLLVRPLLRRVAVRAATDPLPRGAAAGVFVALLLSALTAEVDRHPRHLRRVPARGGHSPRERRRPDPDPPAGPPGHDPAPAGLLCLHRHADADRPGRPAWSSG